MNELNPCFLLSFCLSEVGRSLGKLRANKAEVVDGILARQEIPKGAPSFSSAFSTSSHLQVFHRSSNSNSSKKGCSSSVVFIQDERSGG